MRIVTVSSTLWALVFATLSVLVFNTVMISFDHNEQMYVTAGVLASQGLDLYQDYPYLQTPYLPLIYGMIFALTESTAYLFLAKCVTFLFLIGAAFALYGITRKSGGNQLLAAGITTLFLLNVTVLRAVEESSNYMLPITLTYVSVYLYLHAQQSARWSTLALGLSGALLALAIGTKLYYAFLILPFLVVLIFYSRHHTFRNRIVHQAMPFVIGILIGSLPMLWYLWQDYRAFWFYNVGYHLVNTEWRQSLGYDVAVTLHSKIAYTAALFVSVNNGLLVAVSALAILLYSLAPAQEHPRNPSVAILSVSLFVVSIPTVIVPTPVFAQYYAMPISLLFLPLATLFPTAAQLGKAALEKFLVVIVVLSGILIAPHFQEDLARPWVTREVYAKSREIASAINSRTQQPGKIATIAPIFAIEADRPIYPEFATGPFLYRVGDFLTPEDMQQYTATSPETITSLLAQDPPIAILVSHEHSDYAQSSYRALEEPLRRFAEEHGYHKVERDFYGSELYIRDY